MKKLFAALFQSEQAKRRALLDAEIARVKRIAEILEMMIVSGRYRGGFMCVDLRHAQRNDNIITQHEYFMVKHHILCSLHDESTAANFVAMYHGSDDPYTKDVFHDFFGGCDFERRILLSNFYWAMINKLRHHAWELSLFR